MTTNRGANINILIYITTDNIMSYQGGGGGGRVAFQESYSDVSSDNNKTGHLFGRSSDSNDGVNVGASNSARGEGTTTSELIAKTRFLNCCACLFIILFHTLPIVLNPVRLTLLLSTPMKLILELAVAIVSLFLFIVEARIPILGEKVLLLMRRIAFGNLQLLDMNVARGRVFTLVTIGLFLGLINYMSLDITNASDSANIGDIIPIPTSIAEDIVSNTTSNITNASNMTEFTGMQEGDDINTKAISSSNASSTSILFIIMQCTSLSIWFVIAVVAYTIYVMHTFPDFSHHKAYDDFESPDDALTPVSTGPSWTSNVGTYVDSVRGNIDSYVQGSGYQTVDA